MALEKSKNLEINFKAPSFNLLNTKNNTLASLQELKGKQGTVIMFICNHCPFVLHINENLVALANEYQKKGVNFIAISSNDAVNYPQDGPDKMKAHAELLAYPFPYLYDETQEVAKAYDAACTPDIYTFNKNLELFYHGQLDDSRPGNEVPVTGNDLKSAIDNMLSDKPLSVQKPSMGCNIKWK